MISESLYLSALNQFPICDACLIIGGISLILLVKHAGLVDTGLVTLRRQSRGLCHSVFCNSKF